MNQDQVKKTLLQIEDQVEEFSVIFSGKTSKKVNGLYVFDSREIIIHNRNFSNDNLLLYTAIHEFAHHIHLTQSPVPVGPRAHTIEFRRIFHNLLTVAETKGLLKNVFDADTELSVLTESIRKNMIGPQGELARKLGNAFMQAREICIRKGYRFEDYVERVLQFDLSTARFLIKTNDYELPPSLGYENMKLASRVADPDNRERLINNLLEGQSRDSARSEIKKKEEDPEKQLLKEKKRVEKTISSLQRRLEQINSSLEKLNVR